MRSLLQPASQLVHAAVQPLLRFASRSYVPGPRLADAMRWAARMDQAGVAVTLGYFNADQTPPSQTTLENCGAIEALAGLRRPGYLSVKPPALSYGSEALLAIAAGAKQHGQWLHFDSHGPQTADPTIRALETLGKHHPRLSLTVPGRWTRSLADVEWALSQGVRVRVVKGQWHCPEHPDADPAAGFLSVIDCLAGRAREVAVATHDVPLAREALIRLKRAGTTCELELLCGLPRRDAMALARELGVPVRLYIPFGEAWIPYALGQLRRHPRMIAWVVRDTLKALVRAA
jgi:proline dehydrogenase